MKKFLCSCLLALLVWPAMAQSGRSAIRFRLSDGAPLTIAIDGRYFNKRGTSLVVGDLPPGRHQVKVYRMAGTDGRFSNRAELIFSGRVRLEPETFYQCLVDVYNGSVSLRSRPANGDRDRFSRDENDRDRWADREPGRDRDDAGNERWPSGGRTDADRENAASGPRGNVVTIRQSELDRLKEQSDRQITDGDKQKLLQRELRDKSFSTGQVRQIMGWLTFESTRLEFAKWAYPNVTDPGSYRQLETAFTFSSTKEEFRAFLEQ